MPLMKTAKKIQLIVIFLVLCTACAKKTPELNQEQGSSIPNFGAISNVLSCMFAPNSDECARAKELNNQ